MTEQQCLKALCRIQCGAKRSKKCEDCECFDDKVNIWKCVENTQESLVLRQLIREHFELVEHAKKLQDEADKYKHEYLSMCDLVENPQPYRFEELRKGMWVWDDGEKCCFKCNPAISTDMAQCVTYNAFWYNCGEDEDEFFEEYDEFEEGRFFPPTKAMEHG